jgi:hypothetical protein
MPRTATATVQARNTYVPIVAGDEPISSARNLFEEELHACMQGPPQAEHNARQMLHSAIKTADDTASEGAQFATGQNDASILPYISY